MISGSVLCYNTQNHTRSINYNQWLYSRYHRNINTALLIIISTIIGRLPKSLRTIINSNGAPHAHNTTTQQQSPSLIQQLASSVTTTVTNTAKNNHHIKHRTAIINPQVIRWPYELPDNTGDTSVPATWLSVNCQRMSSSNHLTNQRFNSQPTVIDIKQGKSIHFLLLSLSEYN